MDRNETSVMFSDIKTEITKIKTDLNNDSNYYDNYDKFQNWRLFMASFMLAEYAVSEPVKIMKLTEAQRNLAEAKTELLEFGIEDDALLKLDEMVGQARETFESHVTANTAQAPSAPGP